jgi:hypothetical protein
VERSRFLLVAMSNLLLSVAAAVAAVLSAIGKEAAAVQEVIVALCRANPPAAGPMQHRELLSRSAITWLWSELADFRSAVDLVT